MKVKQRDTFTRGRVDVFETNDLHIQRKLDPKKMNSLVFRVLVCDEGK